MAFIEALGLGYMLPGNHLLFRDVDFKVASGQRVALIGGNGVGKSTLLRIIAGEDKEYIGAVRVEGSVLYLRQFVASADTTIRQLLRDLLPAAFRSAGAELVAAELAAEHDPSDAAGLRYGDGGCALAGARWLRRRNSLEYSLRHRARATV